MKELPRTTSCQRRQRILLILSILILLFSSHVYHTPITLPLPQILSLSVLNRRPHNQDGALPFTTTNHLGLKNQFHIPNASSLSIQVPRDYSKRYVPSQALVPICSSEEVNNTRYISGSLRFSNYHLKSRYYGRTYIRKMPVSPCTSTLLPKTSRRSRERAKGKPTSATSS